MGVVIDFKTIPFPHACNVLPKLMGIPVGTVPADPLKQQMTSLIGPVQHLHGQFNLRLELNILRDARSLPSPQGNLFKPLRQDIQPPIYQSMTMNRRIRHEHPNLAIVRLARCAGILSSRARRFIALFGKTRIIENHNAVWGAKQLAHKALVLFNTSLVIPGRITQKLLQFPGWRTHFLCNVLHVLSLNRHHQTLQIFHAPFSAFRATKETVKPTVICLQLRHQLSQIVLRHGTPPVVFQEYTP
ncbi:MAG: hypothetical protein DDT34_02092 [Firmicutes bacterium]|nr:hypothetical protein [Bacillota bacterium]